MNNGKYKKEVVEKICSFIRAGNTAKDACTLASIHEDTFYTWKKLHPEFTESVLKAEAECKARMIQVVRKAAFGDGEKPPVWQAASWYLERKYQDEYAIKYRLGLEGKDGGPIRIVDEARSKLKGLDKKQLREIATRE